MSGSGWTSGSSSEEAVAPTRVRLGLRGRFSLLLSLVVTTVVAATSAWLIIGHRDDLDADNREREALMLNALERRGEMLAHSVALASERALALMDYLFLSDVLNAALNGDEELRYAAIVDRDGKVVVESDRSRVGQEFSLAPAATPSRITSTADHLDSLGPTLEIRGPIAVAGASFGSLRLVYSLEGVERHKAESAERLDARTSAAMVRAALVALALAAIGSILGAGVAGRTVGPLHRLQVAAALVRSGDLRRSPQVESTDEIGELATTFVEMIERLRRMHLSLGESVGTLRGSVERLDASTSEQSELMRVHAEALQRTEVTTHVLQESAVSAADGAVAVSRLASEARARSEEGRGAVVATIKELVDMRQDVELARSRLAELREKAQMAGTITSSVEELANQSQSLSVNMAIEAAVAGDRGRGLTTLAREVRRLSDASRDASARTQGIIDAILSSLDVVITLTERSLRRIEDGNAQIDRFRGELEAINASLQENEQKAQEISSAAGNQRREIAALVAAISEMALAMKQNLERVTLTASTALTVKQVSEQVAQATKAYRV